MEPRYPSGSYVLVMKTKRVREGDVIAFRLENDPAKVLIKRISRQTDPETFQVAGDNKGDSLDVGPVCRNEVIGKVVLGY